MEALLKSDHARCYLCCVQEWRTTFFSAPPLDVVEEGKKEYLRDPLKVGRLDLFCKVSVDYGAMVDGYSGESESDDSSTFKEAQWNKGDEKATLGEGSGSVAQQTKARRAPACLVPIGGVWDVVNLNDEDDSTRPEALEVDGEVDRLEGESHPGPVVPEPQARSKEEEKKAVPPEVKASHKWKAKAPPVVP